MAEHIDKTHYDERVRIAVGMSEGELTDEFKDGVLFTLELLKTEPTADVREVVHAKWIEYGRPRCEEQHYQCTNCEDYVNFGQWGEYYKNNFRYCPHCGAKMDLEEVEQCQHQ